MCSLCGLFLLLIGQIDENVKYVVRNRPTQHYVNIPLYVKLAGLQGYSRGNLLSSDFGKLGHFGGPHGTMNNILALHPAAPGSNPGVNPSLIDGAAV